MNRDPRTIGDHLYVAALLPFDRHMKVDEAAYRRFTSVPGIGPWTAARLAMIALGDRDAVAVGDLHLPHMVSWHLAGERRGSDARMLELLEPYRGQRARVIRLLLAGVGPHHSAGAARTTASGLR